MTIRSPLRALVRLAIAAAVLGAAAGADAQPAPRQAGAVDEAFAPARKDAGGTARTGFDIETARETVRELVRSGELGLPQPAGNRLATSYSAQSVLRSDRDIQLGRAIAGTARPSCMNAYSGMLLFAIIPLVLDTVRDSGCKW